MSQTEQILAIAHSLKSPILGIKRLSQFLLDDAEALPEDVRRKLELIHDSAAGASEFLTDLNSSGLIALEEESIERVDLVELSRHVVQHFQPQAECKGQTIRSVPPSPEHLDDCFVSGSSLQLREAMQNLVSNALKFSPTGEAIEVRVRRRESMVVFSVSDSGPGLSETDEKKLFEPFQQAAPDPTGEEESTGMGLYLVDQIVDQHDGKIDVESTKGDGSTFSLLFPPASSEPSARGPISGKTHLRPACEPTG